MYFLGINLILLFVSVEESSVDVNVKYLQIHANQHLCINANEVIRESCVMISLIFICSHTHAATSHTERNKCTHLHAHAHMHILGSYVTRWQA